MKAKSALETVHAEAKGDAEETGIKAEVRASHGPRTAFLFLRPQFRPVFVSGF